MKLNKHITLSHGNGGEPTRRLINEVFTKHLGNETHSDAAILPSLPDGEICMATGSYTVQPLTFPGGDIGSLAVFGTLNDLAVSGARPLYLSLAVIIEEGLSYQILEQLVKSLAEAAHTNEIKILCGDTKVVPKGEESGVFFTTTGIGVRARQQRYGMHQIRQGDVILTSGSIGDHGAAIRQAQMHPGASGELRSDAGSVLSLCQNLSDIPGIHFLRAPTCGGLATVAHKIHQVTGYGVELDQANIPINPEVEKFCETDRYEPWYLANGGCVIAVVAEEAADKVLTRWRVQNNDAAVIGRISSAEMKVCLVTATNEQRYLPPLEDDPLPRIC